MTPYLPSLTITLWASLGVVVLLLLNGFLNAAEAALDALRPHHVRNLRETDPKRAARLQELLDHRETHVAACGLGSRLVRFGLVLLTLALAPRVGFWLAHVFGETDDVLGYGWGMLGTVLLGVPLALVNLVVGELVPTAYGEANPRMVLSRLGGLAKLAGAILSLPARGLVRMGESFTSRFGGNAEGTNPLEEEIKTLAESGAETGQMESEERELIHSVFEFADTIAREIMTPRVELDSMPVTSDPADVVRVIEETGHSRIPLYEGTDDDILGVVHAKDLLGAMAQGRTVELRRLLRPILTVHEGKSVRELLGEMRVARTQMAIVQDEFGGTAGVVTIEDIVEELVGDIVDEYDPEESEIMPMDGGWLIAGKAHLDDINERIGSEFESDEFDTVGGFIFGHFGRQPSEGESIDLDRYRFTITETDGRRVLQLRIEPVSEPGLDSLDVA